MRWFASDHWSFRIDPSGPGRPVRSSALSERYAVQRSACSWHPLARHRLPLRGGRAAVGDERHELAHLDLEPRHEREGERPALVQERRHRDVPAAADLADDVLDRHLDAAQEDLVELRVAGDLRERPHLDARRVHVDDQVREAGVPLRVRVGSRDEDAEVGDVRVRRPDLLPVEDEAVAVEPRGGADAREVRAGPGLREPLAPDLVGRQERLEVARLLLLGPAADDRRPRHPEPDHPDVRRRLRPRLLLEVDRLEPWGQPPAAVLRRPRDPDPAAVVERAAPLADLGPVEPSAAAAMATELVGEVLVEPGPQLLAEGSLLRRVAEVHAAMLRRVRAAFQVMPRDRAGCHNHAATPQSCPPSTIGRRARRARPLAVRRRREERT